MRTILPEANACAKILMPKHVRFSMSRSQRTRGKGDEMRLGKRCKE
jgi:hypothetical protein